MADEEKNLTPEEVEQEHKTSLTLKEKAKIYLNKANLSRYLGFMGVLVATVVVSLYQVGWDPNKIGWQVFFANVMILLFLGTYGIFFGEAEGHNFFKKYITGLYQKVKTLFNHWVDKITEAGYVDVLPDYICWRYKKDCEHVYHMKLLSVRLFDDTVLNLTREQIAVLKNHADEFAGTPYDKLSEEQYQAVSDIIEGKVVVDYIDDYNFFIMETANDGIQQVTKVKETNKRKEKISWKQRISRLVMIVILSLIIAGFFKESASGSSEATQQLVSRITVLLGSIASGINTARLLNLEDVFVLEYKISYDKVMYYSVKNGTYIPVDHKERAKKAVEEYKKTLEEAKRNVVEPEVAESNIMLLPNNDI